MGRECAGYRGVHGTSSFLCKVHIDILDSCHSDIPDSLTYCAVLQFPKLEMHLYIENILFPSPPPLPPPTHTHSFSEALYQYDMIYIGEN